MDDPIQAVGDAEVDNKQFITSRLGQQYIRHALLYRSLGHGKDSDGLECSPLFVPELALHLGQVSHEVRQAFAFGLGPIVSLA
jgi:hypothetical protein